MSNVITRKQVVSIIASLTGDKNNIVIPRHFVELTGDIISAALLNQILYWSDKTNDPDGWFYKSAEDWNEELGISAYQINRAINGDSRTKSERITLSSIGVETCIKQSPKGAPTTHYRVDHDKFVMALFNSLGIDEDALNPRDSSIPNIVENGISTMLKMESQQCQVSSYTENTTESTAEIEEPPSPEPQKANHEQDDYQPSAVQELEKAYCDVSNTIYFSNGHKELDMLRAMVDAGVTPHDLTAFVQELKTQDFWKNKRVSLKYIAENIGAWKSAESAKPTPPKITITLPDGVERHEPVNVDGKKYKIILPEDAA